MLYYQNQTTKKEKDVKKKSHKVTALDSRVIVTG